MTTLPKKLVKKDVHFVEVNSIKLTTLGVLLACLKRAASIINLDEVFVVGDAVGGQPLNLFASSVGVGTLPPSFF